MSNDVINNSGYYTLVYCLLYHATRIARLIAQKAWPVLQSIHNRINRASISIGNIGDIYYRFKFKPTAYRPYCHT